MKSRFVNLTNRLGSYNWITNKHLKSMSLGGRGVILFFFLEEDQRRRTRMRNCLQISVQQERKKEDKPHIKPRKKWISGEKRIPPSFIIFS